MPRDPRPFITVHDGMPEHPKIEALSDPAFRLLVTTWCWCNRMRTDGKVKAASWLKRGTARARAELVASGLAEQLDDGVRMHDYLEHQRSAAEIDELSQKRAEAGKRGGKATASAKANAAASATANGQQASGKTQAEVEREELLRSSQRARERFDEFWSTYPRREARPSAEKAWDRAVKRAEPEVIIKAAGRYRDDPNRDGAFTAHPATWLNNDRWNDPPLPARAVVNGQSVASNKPPGYEYGMDR